MFHEVSKASHIHSASELFGNVGEMLSLPPEVRCRRVTCRLRRGATLRTGKIFCIFLVYFSNLFCCIAKAL